MKIEKRLIKNGKNVNSFILYKYSLTFKSTLLKATKDDYIKSLPIYILSKKTWGEQLKN